MLQIVRLKLSFIHSSYKSCSREGGKVVSGDSKRAIVIEKSGKKVSKVDPRVVRTRSVK